MKIKITIASLVVVLIAVIAYIGYAFHAIRMENKPYLSNKEQFLGVLHTHMDAFEALADAAEEYNQDNILFQYNSALPDTQVAELYGEGELSDNILSLIKNAGMTNVHKLKNGDSLTVYQYPPVISSDIQIGAMYDYETDEWTYCYQHDYADCRHKHKLAYRLYDLLYNRTGKL